MMIRYYKGDPSVFTIAYRNGKVVREGAGVSFFYLPINTTLIAVPITSRDAQFAIREATANHQDIVVQGSLTYRIVEPRAAAQALDFSINPKGGAYLTDDPVKLESRIISALQGQARPLLRRMQLEEALAAANQLAAEVFDRLEADPALAALGVKVESVYVVQVAPTPEMKKALETEYRESLNRRADQAIYARRAAALEEERKLKQSELDTEIGIEEGRKALVAMQAENSLTLAEADAKAAEMKLDPYAKLPAPALVALALKDWAAASPKIGQLNLTPDMLTAMAGWMGNSSAERPQARA